MPPIMNNDHYPHSPNDQPVLMNVDLTRFEPRSFTGGRVPNGRYRGDIVKWVKATGSQNQPTAIVRVRITEPQQYQGMEIERRMGGLGPGASDGGEEQNFKVWYSVANQPENQHLAQRLQGPVQLSTQEAYGAKVAFNVKTRKGDDGNDYSDMNDFLTYQEYQAAPGPVAGSTSQVTAAMMRAAAPPETHQPVVPVAQGQPPGQPQGQFQAPPPAQGQFQAPPPAPPAPQAPTAHPAAIQQAQGQAQGPWNGSQAQAPHAPAPAQAPMQAPAPGGGGGGGYLPG